MKTRGGNPAVAALHHLAPSVETLDTHEAAAVLGLSYWTLVSWRRPGNTSAPTRDELPWFYDRGRVVYRANDVERFLTIRAAEITPGGRGA
ncbi:conserved protein of unknown function (plasmid) [Rhodovastum atsumiense]|uniref:Helix-turn-helix domain-containing protein n=1 Tax=Rhodovastum atsumiense TaxID=504468 RepID=A0A5M6IUE0_9PROT|nr:helix-turn-helix domain-containing protein [Rhodovastum atsumiense]KAA5611559.1 hypothetical protein F1189_13420 [Rhodovastum atsumiense]CAH2606212.1 conserved protein of unknown function [Rhodovastum atsumiense]